MDIVRKPLILLTTVAVVALALPALADGDSAVLNVTVDVVSNARIVEVDAVAFGEYDPTGPSPVDAQGAVRVRATKGLSYVVYVSGARKLVNGSGELDYEIYTDDARTTPWGSEAGSGFAVTSSGNGDTNLPIYARIPAGQDVPDGQYSDDLVVTIDW